MISRGTGASLNLRMLRLREMASRVSMARLLLPCRCLQPLFGASTLLLHLKPKFDLRRHLCSGLLRLVV